MPEWLKSLLIFIAGMLFPYVYQVLDLLIQDLVNKQTLRATKIQKEINEINAEQQEVAELQPAIGFQYYPAAEQYDEYEELENKRRKR